MVEKEAQMVGFARIVAIVSVISALAVASGFETNYLNYVKWTKGARASLMSAVAQGASSDGELSLEIDFESPSVGYRTEIESFEFALGGPEGNFGYYRIIIPDGLSSRARRDVSAHLSLHSHIPPQHWPNLRASANPRLDGRLIVRLYLPGKEVPTRVPVAGPVAVGGGLM